MGRPPRIDRAEVLALLATYRERAAQDEVEQIDSLELAWLIHQVEQRYQVQLDLGDDQLVRMATVPGAVGVLDEQLQECGHG
ncbi:acyl carrier protein [Kitasatospora cineracea]|uniref:acyl carrier protein n=1 Tax=Kitasatospora cineracea TaxID=88074 RepID=UPI00368843F4